MIRAFALAICLLILPGLAMAEDMSGYYAPVWMPIKFLTKEELRAKLGEENLIIADVRYFAPLDEGKIPGAVRYHPLEADIWGATIPEDAKVVIY